MERLKTVIAFEYLSVVKTKSFIITMVIFMVLVSGLIALPNIISFFSNAGAVQQAAIIDETGVFTDDILENYFPEYTWNRYSAGNFDDVMQAVADGEYLLGIHLVTQTSYTLIFASGHPPYVRQFEEIIKNAYQREQLLSLGIWPINIDLIMNVEIESTFIPVGNAGTGIWIVPTIALLAVFIPLVMGGSKIGMSIVSEKTSRTVELLFTSAKPIEIMVGKVTATLLIIITQFTPVIAIGLIAMSLTGNDLASLLPPEEMGILRNPLIYFYVLFFSLCAYFTFAFMYAAVSATVRDAQEAHSVQSIPSLLLTGAFYLSMMAIVDLLGETILNVISYIPFISPMVMVVRVTAGTVPIHQILIAMAINLLTLAVVAVASAKIYEYFIMNYGQKISMKLITNVLKGDS